MSEARSTQYCSEDSSETGSEENYNVEEDATDAASDGVSRKDRDEEETRGNENEDDREELVDDAYMDEPLADEEWIRIYNAEMEEARLADERQRKRFEEQETDEW